MTHFIATFVIVAVLSLFFSLFRKNAKSKDVAAVPGEPTDDSQLPASGAPETGGDTSTPAGSDENTTKEK